MSSGGRTTTTVYMRVSSIGANSIWPCLLAVFPERGYFPWMLWRMPLVLPPTIVFAPLSIPSGKMASSNHQRHVLQDTRRSVSADQGYRGGAVVVARKRCPLHIALPGCRLGVGSVAPRLTIRTNRVVTFFKLNHCCRDETGCRTCSRS